jgi:hypothetical protein
MVAVLFEMATDREVIAKYADATNSRAGCPRETLGRGIALPDLRKEIEFESSFDGGSLLICALISMMARSRRSNQRPDTVMQDRINQVDETSCTARPDHTVGSQAANWSCLQHFRFAPKTRHSREHRRAPLR